MNKTAVLLKIYGIFAQRLYCLNCLRRRTEMFLRNHFCVLFTFK